MLLFVILTRRLVHPHQLVLGALPNTFGEDGRRVGQPTPSRMNLAKDGSPLTFLAFKALNAALAEAQEEVDARGPSQPEAEEDPVAAAVRSTAHAARDSDWGLPWHAKNVENAQKRIHALFRHLWDDNLGGVQDLLRQWFGDKDGGTPWKGGFKMPSHSKLGEWLEHLIHIASKPTQWGDNISGGDGDGEHETGDEAVGARERFIAMQAYNFKTNELYGTDPLPLPPSSGEEWGE